MEDVLLTVSWSFADTDSGEVFANSIFHKPLSLFSNDDIIRCVDSFRRGVRSGKKVAFYLTIQLDRDLPKKSVEGHLF